ncbi:MAG: hypothetical protein P4M09_07450 [Devosia sp.]|nr:hypothetical protein [Devosia sp.]
MSGLPLRTPEAGVRLCAGKEHSLSLRTAASGHRPMKPTSLVCILLTLLPAAWLPTPAAAATYSLRLFNGVKGTLTSFRVRDAYENIVPIAAFAPLASGTSEKITVTLPGNDCEAFVDARIDKGLRASGKAAFCIMQTGMALVPTPDGHGLRYVPWTQYRAMGGHPQ